VTLTLVPTNRRPAGRGRGLEGAPCPEHDPRRRGPLRYRMCILCGRVTNRADTDTKPWCGGVT
jgi:hypothetical protein